MFWIEEGLSLQDLKFELYKTSKYTSCNNIICFDIETSSGYIDNGNVLPYNGKAENYEGKEKVSLCYIWQLSIDDNVYMGRFLEDFSLLLDEISDMIDYEVIIYVHNLSFEFQFLQNVLKFDDVFARSARKVLYAKYKNFTFRCSYFLVNMSLDSWSIQKKLDVKKLVGNLDYSKLRTPLTKVTKKEIQYCKNDVLIMYEGLKEYKKIYKSIKNIPLTQTGEVRKEIIKRMRGETRYKRKCAGLIPSTIENYKLLTDVFQGGYTHANFLYANQTVSNVHSWDISSSYPTVMLLEKYPMTPFTRCKPKDKFFNNEKYSYIIHFSCSNVSSKFYNSFLSKSKCVVCNNSKIDNGRIMKCQRLEVKLTNIDFEIFNKCYEYENFNIIDFHISINWYLSDTFLKYTLELFGNKTSLKNIEGMEETYMKSKQYINSLFGMCVTKDITDDTIYNNGEWLIKYLDESLFNEKIEKIKRNRHKVFTAFQFGVWVTAYARRNLWEAIIALDEYSIYQDTDSIKYVGEHEDFFIKYNEKIILKEKERSKQLGVDENLFYPVDSKGAEHRIGLFEKEETYKKFKTLGAKKYIYEDYEGCLHMTVSGVRKKAVEQIEDISEFDINLVFDVEHANKLISHYNDNQTDIVWNKNEYDSYNSSYKHGMSLQPTTYELGMSLDYLSLLLENRRKVTKVFGNE